MSNNLKRLVCGLLATMMVSTSCSIAALAEDTVADTTTEVTETASEATEAPAEETAEATEAPAENTAEATEAPAEATAAPTSNYDNDNTYNTALAVCSALGIITGYEDGSVKPDATVTRAEMATIILRMLKNSDSVYQNVFTDVAADHWAAGTIQTAVEQGIVNGMGDGTFQPDGNVKYEQVIKMIVAAMGYSVDAETSGGYPNGYISVGSSSLSLLKGVNGSIGQDMPRGEVIKAVYNALMAPYRTLSGTQNGQPVYEAKDTLGVEKFNLYEEEGVVVATPNGTITTGVQKKADRMVIDAVQYKVNLTDIDKYLGTKVKFYYIDSTYDDPEVIAVVSSGKSEEVTIEADDIDTMSVYGTNGETAGLITAFTSKTSSTTKKYKVNDATVIYNGSVLTTADYAASEYSNTLSYDDFITPKVGTVKVVDYDADGTYDIVFVDSYETMLVTTATSEKVSGKINGSPFKEEGKDYITTIEIDEGSTTDKVTVIKNGSEATVKNLRKNDVLSLKRNIDNSIIEMVVTGETVTGKITSTYVEDGDTFITVNGTEYEVDKNAADSVKNGMSVILYLDAFDRVGYMESSTGGNLADNEKYAIVIDAYDEAGDNWIVLYTQDGERLTLKPSGSMKYWAPGATEMVSGPDWETVKEDLNASAVQGFISVGSSRARLCKYATNSKNEITKLYVAVASNSTDDTDALTLYNGNLRGVTSVGGSVSGNTIPDGIVQFSIPTDAMGKKDTSGYSVGTVTASAYVNYENGAAKDYTIGDFVDGNKAQVLLVFEGGATTISDPNYTGNASNGPSMMVSSVSEAVDANGEFVFEVSGYTLGSMSEVSYTTAVNTGVYKFSGFSPDYTGTIIYDATSANYDAEDFLEAVQPGDIFHIGASGSTLYSMVKMVDIDDVVASVVKRDETQWQQTQSYSTSRDIWYGGFVKDVEINDTADITIGGISASSKYEALVPYDPSTTFSYCTVKVDSNGDIVSTEVSENGGMEPSEIIYDDDTTMDYGLFKMFKGGMGAGYIVRVEME